MRFSGHWKQPDFERQAPGRGREWFEQNLDRDSGTGWDWLRDDSFAQSYVFQCLRAGSSGCSWIRIEGGRAGERLRCRGGRQGRRMAASLTYHTEEKVSAAGSEGDRGQRAGNRPGARLVVGVVRLLQAPEGEGAALGGHEVLGTRVTRPARGKNVEVDWDEDAFMAGREVAFLVKHWPAGRSSTGLLWFLHDAFQGDAGGSWAASQTWECGSPCGTWRTCTTGRSGRRGPKRRNAPRLLKKRARAKCVGDIGPPPALRYTAVRSATPGVSSTAPARRCPCGIIVPGPMARRLFTLLPAVSLLLCAATLWISLFGFRYGRGFRSRSGHWWLIGCERGRICVLTLDPGNSPRVRGIYPTWRSREFFLSGHDVVGGGWTHERWYLGIEYEHGSKWLMLRNTDPRYWGGETVGPPVQFNEVSVPCTVLTVLAALLPAGWLGQRAWQSGCRKRLASRGLCRHCGHDLRATPGRCPECGAAAAVKKA